MFKNLPMKQLLRMGLTIAHNIIFRRQQTCLQLQELDVRSQNPKRHIPKLQRIRNHIKPKRTRKTNQKPRGGPHPLIEAKANSCQAKSQTYV